MEAELLCSDELLARAVSCIIDSDEVMFCDNVDKLAQGFSREPGYTRECQIGRGV